MKVHVEPETGLVPVSKLLQEREDRTSIAFMYEGHVYGFIRKGGQTCPLNVPSSMVPVINFKQMSTRTVSANTLVLPVDVTINVKGLPR